MHTRKVLEGVSSAWLLFSTPRSKVTEHRHCMLLDDSMFFVCVHHAGEAGEKSCRATVTVYKLNPFNVILAFVVCWSRRCMCCVRSRFASKVEEQKARTVHSWHSAPLHAGIHDLASCSHVLRLGHKPCIRRCDHNEARLLAMCMGIDKNGPYLTPSDVIF
ncbi:hypothetical protein BDR05DRAFT_378301 [Suillus weaverae]|nr:hypothetical protein BDR05DRAFT_378301 [Suillus weaverae]